MDFPSPALFAAGLIAALALAFAFSNGFRDSSTVVATVVSTRALSPSAAFGLCAIFEFGGALLIGSAVVARIGRGLLANGAATPEETAAVLIAALIAAIGWGLVGWWRAWPISNNQALLAGLVGAAAAVWGPSNVRWSTLAAVFAVLISSPLIGFAGATAVTKLIRYAGGWLTPRAGVAVEKLHIGACLAVSAAHGSNDGQMVMGVLLLGAGLFGFTAPGDTLWTGARIVVALSLSLGVLVGGRRLLRRLGMKFYLIKPSQGLGAQFTAAATILTCALSGFPASTTQVITGSIVGAGVAKNPKAVRWGVAREIALSWILTLPAVSVLSYALAAVFLHQGMAR